MLKPAGQVSTVLNPEPDDEDDTEVILSSGDTTMLSTYKVIVKKKLYPNPFLS